MVAGVAHEVGTPLHVISGYAQLIAHGQVAPEAISAKAAIISTQANNVARILRQLLDFAHTGEPDGEPASVLQVASNVAELLGPSARAARVSIMVGGEPVSTVVDEQRLSQVLVNLIANAIDASTEGGTVDVSVTAVHQAPPGGTHAIPCVRTIVRDAGIGISDIVRARLFEPFFTTKGIGKGTGLGLSVVDGIVAEHGGWITVDSALGSGSRFTVFLPAVDTSSADGGALGGMSELRS
jgi:two-component system, NtrC family, sensor kinase